MVFEPKSLLVYLVVFLAFNPEDISTKLLPTQTIGKLPEHADMKSWFPEKETVKMGEEGTTLVHFDEKVRDKNKPKYAQQMKSLVRFLGKKYTRIVVRVSNPKFETLKKTRTMEFIKAICAENLERRNQGINLIEVYIQISTKLFLGEKSVEGIESLIIRLINRITQRGKINGLILEASFVQSLETFGVNETYTTNDAVYLKVQKIKKAIKALESSLGYKLKLGLLVNSSKSCQSSLKMFKDTVSLFDVIVYKHVATGIC